MFELLQRVTDHEPNRPAILTHDGSWSYGELAEASLRVGEALVREGIARFAVVDHAAEIVVPLIAGASIAGAEACQYPPVGPEEVRELLARFDHDVLVTDRTDLSGLGARIVATRELLGVADTQPTELAPPDERPHLILTTGTTGAPRGVCHDWARLLHGTTRSVSAPAQRWLLAFGLHQFAGLQVLLHVFAVGATLVAPAPRRPREGLAAMRELGVTHASATPTYWRFLLAEMGTDGGVVPALRQVTMGGEAVPGPLIGQVRRAFPAADISQVYAASEFGSTGSVRDGRPGLSAAVLDRGESADVDLRIVDGELWVRSRTGMLGYYGEPPIDADGWRATGDRVEIEDGRIVFCGRTSEIINVGGVKVHPLPVEERIAAVDGVVMARVHGRPNAMTGAIVAVEIVAASDADHEQVRVAIRAACDDLPAAARPRSIRFVEDIATTGTKIVRRTP